MSLKVDLAQALLPLLDGKKSAEAIELLEKNINASTDLDEFVWMAHRLAEVHFDAGEAMKASRFGALAVEGYMRLGRFAAALAVFDWLRQKKVLSANEFASLEKKLLQQVVPRGNQNRPKEDDHLPPPTPYQEMVAFVAFDRNETSSFREQWQQVKPKRVALFSGLKQRECAKLLHAARLVQLKAGETLFQEGDDPVAFYIIAEGEMQLSASTGYTKTFSEGDFFGEIALFADIPRTATLKTKYGAKLLEFPMEVLQKAFHEIPSLEAAVLSFYELRLFLTVALRHPLFKSLSEADLEKMWDYLLPVHVSADEVLMLEGDSSDRFYLISKGVVEIKSAGKVLGRLGAGQFFGEIGLLRDVPRTAQARTLTDCTLLECQKDTFQELVKRFPKFKRILDEVAKVRVPDEEITDKVKIILD